MQIWRYEDWIAQNFPRSRREPGSKEFDRRVYEDYLSHKADLRRMREDRNRQIADVKAIFESHNPGLRY